MITKLHDEKLYVTNDLTCIQISPVENKRMFRVEPCCV